MAILQSDSIIHTQNFLRSRPLVDRLVEASTIAPGDLVIEIGPGRGIITERLARKCRQLVAIEKDPMLVGGLRQNLATYPNLEIRSGDFLEYILPRQPYKVFASIPFDITAAIVGKLTSGLSPPDDAYLVMQREAALRFIGSPRETLASTLLQPWFEPTLVHTFRRTDFAPVPAVDVVMLRLRKRTPPFFDPRNGRPYRDFLVHCFTSRQPSVAATLDRLIGRESRRKVLDDRPEAGQAGPSEVCFGEWLAIFQRLSEVAGTASLDKIRGSECRLRQQQARLEKVHRTRLATEVK